MKYLFWSTEVTFYALFDKMLAPPLPAKSAKSNAANIPEVALLKHRKDGNETHLEMLSNV